MESARSGVFNAPERRLVNAPFPIPIPERLPERIEPCPIVEAIFEARFVSACPWDTMPGLVFAQIRDKYPEQKSLPLAEIPTSLRQNPALSRLPLIQFLSGRFLIQMGPRVVNLVTRPPEYPGWPAIREELGWLTERLKAAAVIQATERLSVRYVDFFEGDIFESIRLGLAVDGQRLCGLRTDLATLFQRELMTVRLHVTNSAIVEPSGTPRTGSVVDLDAWFGPQDADLFANGLPRFEEARRAIKELFFGLLREDVLDKFNPVYS